MKQNTSLNRLGRYCKPACLVSLGLLLAAPLAQAQGTALSYQGRLTDNGSPANGNYDLRFDARDAATAGNQLGSSTLSGVAVSNGLFTVALDFGAGVFTGPARWLEIAARPNGSGNFTTLSPRQLLTPVPYAIFASNAATATTASGVAAGSVTAAGVASGQVVKSLNGLTDAVTLSPGPNVTLATNGNNLTVSSTGEAGVFSLNGTSAYYNAGDVGIGTPNPTAVLQVHTTGLDQQIYVSSGAPSVTLGNDGVRSSATMKSQFVLATAAGHYGLNAGDSMLCNLGNSRGNIYIDANYSGTGSRDVIIQPGGGNVSIGTGSSDYQYLRIGGGNSYGFMYGSYNNPALRDGIHLGYNYYSDAAGADQVIHPDGATSRISVGYGGIWLATGVAGQVPVNHLVVDSVGNVTMDNNCSVATLTIRGGADLAEPFEISPSQKEVPEGAVMVIDEENPGHLKMSTRAYDSHVAGVISGANGVNPGIQMQQQGLLERGKNVALTGRVYVQADASFGAIKPGDLLTTSHTPGRAMKVSNQNKAPGAILGKAMSTLESGQGYVLVLVSLQ